MYKKIIIITCLLNLSNLFSQNIIGDVLYIKNIYTPKISKKDDDKYNDFLKKLRDVKNIEYKLQFSKFESLFQLKERLDSDTENGFVNSATKISGGNGIYYTNTQTKEILHGVEFSGTNYIITSSLDSLKWKLTNEKKKFGKYTCFKATTIKINKGYKTYYKKVEAWYCPELPYYFGPINYGGLPGLIFEIKIEKGATFTLKSIKLKPKKSRIKTPKKGKKVTPNQYNEICKKAYMMLKEGM